MSFKEWRRFRGLTLEACADVLVTSKGYLSEIERGVRRGSPELAKRIEIFTNGEVTAASLLGLNERPLAAPAGRTGVREEAAAFKSEDPSSDRPWRRPVSVAVELTLTEGELEDIRAYVPDLEAVAREAGLKAIRAAYKAAWGEATRDAIEANNRWIEEHGTFAEQMGLI